MLSEKLLYFVKTTGIPSLFRILTFLMTEHPLQLVMSFLELESFNFADKIVGVFNIWWNLLDYCLQMMVNES